MDERREPQNPPPHVVGYPNCGYPDGGYDSSSITSIELRTGPLVRLRDYQKTIFDDDTSGILVLHWARQIGKSYTLAAWAVHRLLSRPGRLVTVLSNSRDNGAEFVRKCAEICRLNQAQFVSIDRKAGGPFADFKMEVRIRNQGKIGRIKVLAANPRTARGFSGDLILDEFAFHEDSAAIWEAAEPILASNPDFLCRIASTANGRHNMFYRIVAGSHRRESIEETQNIEHPTSNIELRTQDGTERPRRIDGTQWPEGAVIVENIEHPIEECGQRRESVGEIREQVSPQSYDGGHTDSGHNGTYLSTEGFKVSRVTRTMAHEWGVPVFDAKTRKSVSPAQARAQALDKRAYDQNYECSFADENMTLLTHELISAAERDDVGYICEQDWSNPISTLNVECSVLNVRPLELFRSAKGELFVGFDVGRNCDLSVITVIEKLAGTYLVRGILRLRDMRLPEQELRLGEICRLRQFQRAAMDMTGLGLGLFEYAQKSFGSSRIRGVNFASTVPATNGLPIEGRKRETVRVTEAMATELLRVYEDRRIQHPRDGDLRDDLRKPEKITSPGGRVSIAATRDEAGHADHFWSLALAIEAAKGGGGGASMTINILKHKRRYLL